MSELLRAVREFGGAHERFAGALKHEMTMNANDLMALRLLTGREQLGQRVTPHEIAHHLRVSTASTTKLLDRLVESGHVRRVPHPSDRRARVVELTAAARAEFWALFAVRMDGVRAALADVPAAELTAAAAVMRRVSAVLDPGD